MSEENKATVRRYFTEVLDKRIAEEWVCRDELGMLITVGVLSSRTASDSEDAQAPAAKRK